MIHSSGIAMLRDFFEIDLVCGLDRAGHLEKAKTSDCIIVKSVVNVDKDFLDNAPKLSVVARAGTGLDNIDVSYAKSIGKQVLSVPTGNTISAAEYTVLFILMATRRINEVLASVANNDFRRHLLEGRELKSLKVGLIGLGNVGIEVSRRLKSFGCSQLTYDPFSKNLAEFKEMGGQVCEDLDSLCRNSDIISLHLALNSQTRQMVNKNFLSKLKPGTSLINTARGGLVDENAILAALDKGQLELFITDFTYPEPPFDLKPIEHNFNHPFLKHPKVMITPHLGASTIDAQKRISEDLATQIIGFYESNFNIN